MDSKTEVNRIIGLSWLYAMHNAFTCSYFKYDFISFLTFMLSIKYNCQNSISFSLLILNAHIIDILTKALYAYCFSINFLVLLTPNWLSLFLGQTQGPLAAPVLQLLTKVDLSKIYFGDFHTLDIHGSHCFLTRTGYIFSLFLKY